MKEKKTYVILGFVTALVIITISYTIFHQHMPWRMKLLVNVFLNASLSDLRICLCLPEREIELSRGDGLRIRGSLYLSVVGKQHAGILFLHGNTPQGRKLPMYRVIAKKLQERGYSVLAIDFAGFGESENPFSLNSEAALNNDQDTVAAIEYLKKLPNIDQQRLYIIGHSMGATSALSVGISEPQIKAIIVIGPPRRLTERLSDSKDRDYFWRRAQETFHTVYRETFPDWYSREVWLKTTLRSDMSSHIDYFSTPGHKPLLLLDGGRETKADKAYLREYYDKISGPKRYVTISNSDHYANSHGFFGVKLYDIAVVKQTVDAIDKWLLWLSHDSPPHD